MNSLPGKIATTAIIALVVVALANHASSKWPTFQMIWGK